MKLCRFIDARNQPRVGILDQKDTVADLTAAGVADLTSLFESSNLPATLTELSRQPVPRLALASVRLLAPVEGQEVWAAGVTYLRSKTARMEESDLSASAY